MAIPAVLKETNMGTGIPARSEIKRSVAVRGSAGLQSFLIRHAAQIRWISAALILIAVVLLIRILPVGRVLEPVQGWVDSLGPWGPLVLGIIYVVAVLLLVPGSILTLLAGATYGLVLGTIIVWFAATIAAALAFLIARHIAREKVRSYVERSPRLTAVDEAIGEQGWKIVALLRLSPVVPFSLQNYLYGVTAIRFWPYVLATWLAMLPGTFLYVYIGSLGKTAAAGGEISAAEWTARGVGLIATLVATFYLARVARKAIARRTRIEETGQKEPERSTSRQPDEAHPTFDPEEELGWPWSTIATAALAVAILILALWATVRNDAVRQSIERLTALSIHDMKTARRSGRVM